MKQSRITIVNNHVIIENLDIFNKELAEHLSGYINPDQEVMELIASGLQIAKYAKSTASIEQLEHVGDRVQEGIEKVGKKTRQDIEDLLAAHTDPKNSKSLAKAIVDIASTQFIREFNPDNAGSPINQLFSRLDSISRVLERQTGAKESTDKSSRKGGNFNSVMSPIVQSIAANHLDYSEFVDSIETESGGKVGDEIVTINPEYSKQDNLRFVFEFKTAERVTQSGALRELSEAMNNRDAMAGIFVVNRTAKTEKWPEYSFYSGNRMIIVVDKDNPDFNLIRFAYMHTRWILTRELSQETKLIDENRMKYLIDKAQDDLGFISQIRKSLTGIHSSHGEAVSRVDELERRLTATFNEAADLMINLGDGMRESDKVA